MADFFLSYAHSDAEFATAVKNGLSELGYTVDIGSEISEGSAWEEYIAELVRGAEYFIPIISQKYCDSFAANELILAEQRGKNIIPIMLGDIGGLRPNIVSIITSSRSGFVARMGLDDVPGLVTDINFKIGYDLKRNHAYELISEYSKSKNHDKRAVVISEQLKRLQEKYKYETHADTKRVLRYEAFRLLELIGDYFAGYDEGSRELARTVLDGASCGGRIISDISQDDGIYDVCVMLRTAYLKWQITSNGADTISHGDVIEVDKAPYIEEQEPFAQAYKRYRANAAGDTENKDLKFILETASFIFGEESAPSRVEIKPEHKKGFMSDTDKIYHSIASFMREGNNLFNLLSEQNMEGDFLKCLLTSYERLRNYCDVVGADEVSSECIERIAEIKAKLAAKPESTASDGIAEEGIKSLLGINTAHSGKYDVFISFKNEDYDLASTVYKYCRENLVEPFWSKVSLPELSKSDYESAIDNALDNSKHFVIVLSKIEYMETSWVKREMDLFSSEILENRKPDSNFVFLVTDDLYEYIIGDNKKCLPLKYRKWQIIKMSEMRQSLLQYIK